MTYKINAAVGFSKRRCRYWVQLSCGHDSLVSDAQLYGGFGVCKVCPISEGLDAWDRLRATSRKIVRRWNLEAKE